MAHPRVVLYSKPDCHLCELAADILRDVSRDVRFAWRRVNVESDPSLFERFRYEIPVIEVEGGVLLTWPTTPERIRRAIRAASVPT